MCKRRVYVKSCSKIDNFDRNKKSIILKMKIKKSFSLAIFSLICLLNRSASCESLYRTTQGFLVSAESSGDHIQNYIVNNRTWEPHVVSLSQNIIRDGDWVVDAGAYIGLHSLLFARLVGLSGRVFCFEPSPNIFVELQENLSRNQFTNCTLFNYALGEDSSVGVLGPANPSNEGGRPLIQVEGRMPEGSVEVPVRRLDDLDLERLDFMKVDVEGYEEHLFRGAKRSLMQHRPVIVFEVLTHPPFDSNTIQKGLSFIERFKVEYRYRVYHVAGDDYLGVAEEDARFPQARVDFLLQEARRAARNASISPAKTVKSRPTNQSRKGRARA